MEFEFTKEQEDFRQEVREFCQKEPWGDFAPEIEAFFSPSLFKKTAEKGWLGLPFPKEYGGQGKDAVYETIFLEEVSSSGVPFGVVPYGFHNLFAHTIFECGTERQKKEYLPRILAGEMAAGQMFTEPEAGSDLASVKTTAVRKGDYYIVNGQKMFSSLFDLQYGLLMARTAPSAPLEKGISLFILDKSLPGVSSIPVEVMLALNTTQVFLDNVKIPRENLIGEENRGWDYFMRVKPYYWHKSRVLDLGSQQMFLDGLVKYVRETESNGQPLSKNPAVRQKIAELAIDRKTFRLLVYRLAWERSKGLDISACSTTIKIICDGIFLRFGNKAMQVLGLAGQLGGGASYAPLSGIIEGIYRFGALYQFIDSGGASTARNLMATHILGLPEFK